MADSVLSDFDELPFEQSDEMQSAVTFVEPKELRKCRRHVWITFRGDDGKPGIAHCVRCEKVKDEALSRRGRSSRRLGSDGERRSEKRYGWRKTGEFGGIDDLVGKFCIVQQKTTRAAAPAKWKGIFARLDERAAGRVPLILLSFVRAGVDTEDFVLVRGRDWLALHGTDAPE
jgi:hypothetical protein